MLISLIDDAIIFAFATRWLFQLCRCCLFSLLRCHFADWFLMLLSRRHAFACWYYDISYAILMFYFFCWFLRWCFIDDIFAAYFSPFSLMLDDWCFSSPLIDVLFWLRRFRFLRAFLQGISFSFSFFRWCHFRHAFADDAFYCHYYCWCFILPTLFSPWAFASFDATPWYCHFAFAFRADCHAAAAIFRCHAFTLSRLRRRCQLMPLSCCAAFLRDDIAFAFLSPCFFAQNTDAAAMSLYWYCYRPLISMPARALMIWWFHASFFHYAAFAMICLMPLFAIIAILHASATPLILRFDALFSFILRILMLTLSPLFTPHYRPPLRRWWLRRWLLIDSDAWCFHCRHAFAIDTARHAFASSILHDWFSSHTQQ